MKPAFPRALRDRHAVEQRIIFLQQPHIAPLTAFVDNLRRFSSCEVPYIDPLDGGINARMLFLFEKPGPMSTRGRLGSGFISRDNDDPTAQATFTFMQHANIPRETSLLWNAVPGWNGTRRVTSLELAEGIVSLGPMLSLLHSLEVIVLVGNKAQRAASFLASTPYRIFTSPHPSPIVRAASRAQWESIPGQWADASRALSMCSFLP